MCIAVLMYCYIQHIEFCVQLYWCTVIYSTGNFVYTFTGLLLYTAQGLCVQLYWFTVIYSTDTFVYSCTGVLLYTAQGIGNCIYSCTGLLLYRPHVIVCKAVLLYCYIEQRVFCVRLYWCTVICSTGILCTAVLIYCHIQHREIMCTAVLVYCYIE